MNAAITDYCMNIKNRTERDDRINCFEMETSVSRCRTHLRGFNFCLKVVSLPAEYQVCKEDTVVATEL
jgi:hypothetical protein